MKRSVEMIFLYAQVVFSVCIIMFGISYAVRSIIEKSGDVCVILFGCIAFAVYQMMYRTSIKELHEARARRKGGVA